jgi:hypothetical protein
VAALYERAVLLAIRDGGPARGKCHICASNLFGLSEEIAGATTAVDMALIAASHPRRHNRIIQILSAINYRFLGPNSR